jgi:transcriptional regulator with XRE-family HTH domain
MTAVDESVTTDRAELNEYIGWHIRYYRVRAGWLQTDLANEVCINAATLSTWETGRAAPSVASLVAIAEVIGIARGLLLPRGGA